MFSECTLSFSFFCTNVHQENWMHFSHFNVNAATYFRCGQNLLTMYMLKYIEMSSLMHIVLIEMYVELNAHELYIWLPDECTLNAHCNVHCLFATVHLKHWLMYIWCALGRGFYMYFWMHFSHYNVIDAMYFRCGQNLLTMYILKYIEMSSLMHIVLIGMYVECTMNVHELYIWLPDECTLNAHCNVHYLFATVHLKHWLYSSQCSSHAL
jgi:hypothetical protein